MVADRSSLYKCLLNCDDHLNIQNSAEHIISYTVQKELLNLFISHIHKLFSVCNFTPSYARYNATCPPRICLKIDQATTYDLHADESFRLFTRAINRVLLYIYIVMEVITTREKLSHLIKC